MNPSFGRKQKRELQCQRGQKRSWVVKQGQSFINGTKVIRYGILPSGYSRSYMGFLLIKINQDVVNGISLGPYVNQALCKRQIMIVSLQLLVSSFKPKIMDDKVVFESLLRKGFILLKTNRSNIVQMVLMLTMFRTSQGLCILYCWVLSFNLFGESDICDTNGQQHSMCLLILGLKCFTK